jgi:HK97 family phage major capsid protein/HK97 family phage prohead protease
MNPRDLPPLLTRDFAVPREAINIDARTIDLAFSSEAPVERWWGTEILDHTPSAVRLARMNNGAAVLLDHHTRTQIGVITRAWLGEDKKGRAQVKLSRSALGEEILQDVQDGIRQLISVGYQIHDMKLESSGDAGDVYRISDWEPLEISIVAVPADATVGIGRNNDWPARPAVKPKESTNMETSTATGDRPDIRVVEAQAQAQQGERDRQQQIRALALLHNERDFGAEACDKGMTLDAFRGALLERIASTATLPQPPSQIGMTLREIQRYSIFKLIRALSQPGDRAAQEAAAFELDAHRAVEARLGVSRSGGIYVPLEIQKRDLSVGTADAGGYLVATDNLGGSFIDLLRNRALVAQLGAVMMGDLVGNVTIPKQTAAGTAYWLATETTAITESQLTLGQLALSPKTVGALTEITRLLMLQSSPSAEQLVMNDLAAVLALAIDAAALAGPGSGGAPTGIIGTAGVGSVTGTSLGYPGVIEFQTDVESGNALAENMAYVTTPVVAGLLMQRARFSSTDTPLWTGSVRDGLMVGYRAAATNQMPAGKMIFGDWSQVVIASWGVLELKASESHGSNFASAITTIRAMASVDIGIRIAAAFSASASIT